MDLEAEKLQSLSVSDILKESISIRKRSPKTFYLITLTLIFPISFAILAHSLSTHPIISQLQSDTAAVAASNWSRLLIFQFFYLIFIFAFSFLSTAAVVSLYTSKPVSFSSTVAVVPSVFRRLFVTFLWIALLMVAYNIVFLRFLVLLVYAVDTQNVILFVFSILVVFALFLGLHVYISAWWHLASVVSVLEPVYGFTAMKKSYELLKERTYNGFTIVFDYLTFCRVINGLFGSVVVHGGDDYGVLSRIMVGGFLVGVLVIVNLIGLLVHSVFYYVCKSYHHQGIGDHTVILGVGSILD
ncbi:uncharacterized protein LOC131026268 isoform X2 [Salvia miltiorrhiza]|uniref:uncharacterized protein LOC131026268 isoform X2 n=1 Tax=Salvia miltiorrhiza TaxID=226208 RepID=UPI0025AC8C59|nr:uncharacterized protein LOC131026268 isoform X2 [Salvia miltiorrhiza]